MLILQTQFKRTHIKNMANVKMRLDERCEGQNAAAFQKLFIK